ncbi:MAG: peptide chain release factor N(5)-glutamine methyltransferase, partial [Bacteroidales bacterium]|nr:peptide chain release factor N(5)-glutamine methyltransferase [Bacteroidales bacterium]
MKREKLTISSLRNYLRDNLASLYPERELNAIIKIITLHISKKDNTFILTHPDHDISSYTWFKVNKIVDDLKKMKPVQYVCGMSEFYGLQFSVNEYTLIPRQETEELVDLIIRDYRDKTPLILDIGTGSGCIAISLALNITGSRVSALDKSQAVIKVASGNAKENGVMINFFADDILNPDTGKYAKYDLVVSNPPYITESEKDHMGRNVLDYEPHDALFVPDDDPLMFYRAIMELCTRVLLKDGYLYFEINETKGREMRELMLSYGYR